MHTIVDVDLRNHDFNIRREMLNSLCPVAISSGINYAQTLINKYSIFGS